MKSTGKLFLILEVIALFIGGSLLSRMLSSGLGLREWLAEANTLISADQIEFKNSSFDR